MGGQKGHLKLSKAVSAADGYMSREEKCMTLDSAMLKKQSQHGVGKKGGGRLGSSAMGPAPPPLVSNAAAKPSSPASPEETRGGASSLASNSAPPSATNNVDDGKPFRRLTLSASLLRRLSLEPPGTN